MRVFFYIPSLSAGGAERQCAIVAAGLRGKYGHDVSVLLNYAESLNATNNELLQASAIPVVGLSMNPICAFAKLYRILRKNRDAIVFTYLASPNLVGSLAAKMAGLTRVYSGIRCGWLPLRKQISEILVNRILATGTIFNSYRAFDKFTHAGFVTRKCRVISNAIRLWDESPTRPKREVVRIATVGRFTPEKDYHTWLRVIRNVVQKGYRVEAHIVGWGRLETDVYHWIDNMQLRNVVTMHPGDSDVRALLADSDIYLSTSISEGVSNAILEAMNSGLPVVTTDAGDANRMVKNGISGYVTRLRDVTALTNAVTELIIDHSMRIKFGQNARRILVTGYSVDRVVEQYNDLIMESQMTTA